MLYAIYMRSVALLFSWVLMGTAMGQSGSPAQALLEKHCLSCHGAARMSGLDLRQRETALQGGKRGPAIVPGKPDESVLYRAVARQGDLQMPPGKLGLPPEDVAALRSWIESGAPWNAAAKAADSSWWAFRKKLDAQPPPVKNAAWTRNPVDAFILSKLEEKGLRPAAEAGRRTLIRRAYFDLHGLPPAPEEVEQFVQDQASDAYDPQESALDVLESLAEDPFLDGALPLQGRRDYFRVRFHQDQYRIIYRISQSQTKVVVTRIAPRNSSTYIGYERTQK
jgi:mRNA-degrading endonuclease RelE of RelBE toxin-antitoxin system